MNFEEKKRSDWKFRRVVEILEVGIGKINYDAVDRNVVEKNESKKFDAIDVGLETKINLKNQ